MAKVAIIADVHAGNLSAASGEVEGSLNDRFRKTLLMLYNAILDVDVLVIAGDLFDTSKPLPQMVRAVGQILQGVPRTVLIVGNHDQHSTTPGDNAMAVLELIEGVTVYEAPARIDDLGMTVVPYGYDYRDAEVIVRSGDVVVAHHGIRDDAMEAWTRDKGVPVDDLVEFLGKTGASHYLAGDWHTRRSWGRGRIQQIGALSPKDWSNPGFEGYGTVLTYDTNAAMKLIPGTAIAAVDVQRRVVPGPRFITSSDPADVLEHRECRWLYVKTTYPASARDFPPGAYVSDAAEATGAEGETRTVSDHLAADEESQEQSVVTYVNSDPEIPQELKAEVARRALSHLR